MSVVIRGMKMPKSCDECDLNYDCFRCILPIENSLLYGKDTENGRLPNCPLIELPPHGRLIDVDALITTFCEWGTRLERSRKLVITMCEAKQAIVDIIEDATTIIEAEEVSE